MITNGVDLRTMTQATQPKAAAGKLQAQFALPPASTAAQNSMQATTQPQDTEGQLIKQAVDKVNEILRQQGHEIQFQIDKATGFSVVQVRDPKTNEIIQQIPSEQMLEIAKTLGQEPGQLMNTLA